MEACPVRRQCAAHALIIGEEYGVWGGFSEHDRSVLREVGWRDALDPRRMADVVRLESRLKGVRLRLQRMKAGRSLQPLASRAS